MSGYTIHLTREGNHWVVEIQHEGRELAEAQSPEAFDAMLYAARIIDHALATDD